MNFTIRSEQEFFFTRVLTSNFELSASSFSNIETNQKKIMRGRPGESDIWI